MSNIQALLDLRNQLNKETEQANEQRKQAKQAEMTNLIDTYIELNQYMIKTLIRSGIIKSKYQFGKTIYSNKNYCYDLEYHRLKPQLKDLVSIQNYITNILANLTNLLDEYTDKQVIQNSLNRLLSRYSQLFVDCQKFYLS